MGGPAPNGSWGKAPGSALGLFPSTTAALWPHSMLMARGVPARDPPRPENPRPLGLGRSAAPTPLLALFLSPSLLGAPLDHGQGLDAVRDLLLLPALPPLPLLLLGRVPSPGPGLGTSSVRSTEERVEMDLSGRQSDREIVQLLHSLDGGASQGLATLKPGARNSISIFHLSGRIISTGAAIQCFFDAQQEAGWKSEIQATTCLDMPQYSPRLQFLIACLLLVLTICY